MTPAALTFPDRQRHGETMTISLADAFPDLTGGRKDSAARQPSWQPIQTGFVSEVGADTCTNTRKMNGLGEGYCSLGHFVYFGSFAVLTYLKRVSAPVFLFPPSRLRCPFSL